MQMNKVLFAWCFTWLSGLSSPLFAEDGIGQKLMPGDRLGIKVFEEDQMTGSYTIDATGTITLPIIGGVKVLGMTLDQSQKAIETSLSKGYYTNPVVSVRVDEFRPIYVLGQVKTPGSYAYRNGLTAVGAIAVAGGTPSLASSPLIATSELVSAEERVSVLSSKLAALSVRVAGYEALRDGRASIEISDLPAEVMSARGVSDLMTDERRHIQIETEALNNELEVLKRQQPQFAAEKEALELELSVQKDVLVLFNDHNRRMRDLQDRQLARSRDLLEPAQQKAMTESSIARLKSSKSRNEIERAATELKMLEKRNSYMQRILAQLNELKSGVSETSIQLQHALKLRELRRQALGLNDKQEVSNVSCTIERAVDDVRQQILANSETLVEPGDIIEVRNIAPNSSEQNCFGLSPKTATAASGAEQRGEQAKKRRTMPREGS